MRNTIKMGDKVIFDSDRKVGTVTGWYDKKNALVSWAHGRAIIAKSKLTKV